MAVDIDDTMNNMVSAVEEVLRKQFTDCWAEVLENVATEVEAGYDDSEDGADHADGEVDADDDETTWTASEVHELLKAAYVAGRQAGWDECAELARTQIDSAKYSGYRAP